MHTQASTHISNYEHTHKGFHEDSQYGHILPNTPTHTDTSSNTQPKTRTHTHIQHNNIQRLPFTRSHSHTYTDTFTQRYSNTHLHKYKHSLKYTYKVKHTHTPDTQHIRTLNCTTHTIHTCPHSDTHTDQTRTLHNPDTHARDRQKQQNTLTPTQHNITQTHTPYNHTHVLRSKTNSSCVRIDLDSHAACGQTG